MDDAYWAAFPPVLSIDDLVQILGKSPVTIWRWLNRGVIPGHKITDKAWIVYQEELRIKLLDPNLQPRLPHQYLEQFPDNLTVEQVAQLLGKTEQTAYNWLAADRLPAHKLATSWIIHKVEQVELLEKTSNQ